MKMGFSEYATMKKEYLVNSIRFDALRGLDGLFGHVLAEDSPFQFRG
jgi:hypothetical protein